MTAQPKMVWLLLHPKAKAMLGYIPAFLDSSDPRRAREQFNTNYIAGWHPSGLDFTFNPDTYALSYPGDPTMHPVASTQLRDETILVYPYAWVLILQADGSYELERMD